jgi:FtsZ-binding cell division protein ZapB
MLVAIIAFFVVAGAVVLVAGLKLVGLREVQQASVGPDVEVLGIEELKMRIRAMVEDTQRLQDACAQLEREDQQIREMVLGDRLASRDAVLTLIKRDAKLQQLITAMEVRLRQVESDREPERAPARNEWVLRPLAAAATA